jgi:hypothetical protein
MHEEAQPAKQTGKTLAALLILGITAQWAPTLCSLLVAVLMLNYAGYAWRMFAKLPEDETAELLALAGFALGAGFLAKLGVAPLILTGLILIVTVPLWRIARRRQSNDATPNDDANADDRSH